MPFRKRPFINLDYGDVTALEIMNEYNNVPLSPREDLDDVFDYYTYRSLGNPDDWMLTSAGEEYRALLAGLALCFDRLGTGGTIVASMPEYFEHKNLETHERVLSSLTYTLKGDSSASPAPVFESVSLHKSKAFVRLADGFRKILKPLSCEEDFDPKTMFVGRKYYTKSLFPGSEFAFVQHKNVLGESDFA